MRARVPRANNAPFTTSGRLTSANTGRSRLVKYGRRTAASSSVKFSEGYTPNSLASSALGVPGRGGDGIGAVRARRGLRRRNRSGCGSDHEQERPGEHGDGHERGRRGRDPVELQGQRPAIGPDLHLPAGGLGDGGVRAGARPGAGATARAARSPRPTAYTWISARPSPGWPRGTTSLPRRYCPLATTTPVAGPSWTTRSPTRTRSPGAGEPPGPVGRGADDDDVHREEVAVVGGDPEGVELELQRRRSGRGPADGEADGPGEVGACIGPELHPGARMTPHRGREGGVVAAHLPLGRARGRSLPRSTLLDHPVVPQPPATLDAATTPR